MFCLKRPLEIPYRIILLSTLLCFVVASHVDAPGNVPRITDSTPQQFVGEKICVCGNFPTPESQQSITIDGRPVGPPEAAYPNVVVLRLPADLSPGRHTIGGVYSAGFPRSDEAKFLALKLKASVGKDILQTGESTMLKIVIEGTTQPVKLDLINLTPAIILLQGGLREIVTTSGGNPNQVERIVTGIQAYKGVIKAQLAVATCPCAGTTTDASDEPQDKPIDEGQPVGDQPETPVGDVPETPIEEKPRKPCEFKVEGAFEPSQGAWQDDPYFKKYDLPQAGNKLRKISDTSYKAELAMIQGRPTLLFGTGEMDFNQIILKGHTTGSTPVNVQLVFTLYQGATRNPIYRVPKEKVIYLYEPCGEKKEFTFEVETQKGVSPEELFTFPDVGSYKIEAELMRAGTEIGTGIKVEVTGEVKKTEFAPIHFVPLLRSAMMDERFTRSTGEDLQKISDRLAAEAEIYIDDLFPVAPGVVKAVSHKLLDLSNNPDINRKAKDLSEERDIHYFLEEELKQALQLEKVETSARMSAGGWVIVVLRDPEMTLDPTDRPNGLAISDKVILMSEKSQIDTVAHEIVHTMPWWWRETQMQEDCGENFHDLLNKIAYGFRIMNGAKEEREKISQRIPLMGAPRPPRWISQCTYMHLIQELQKMHDPRVVLVRGIAAKDSSRNAGRLFAAYEYDSVVDLPSGGAGGWAIVVRDKAARVLGRYAFEPVWHLPDMKKPRKVVSFAYRVPWHGETSRIDLEGPNGILDSITFSSHPPEIRILSPQEGESLPAQDGKIQIRWSGTDSDGDPLVYTVYYSPDGGRVWLEQAFEQKESSVEVSVDPGSKNHLIKLIATDGARSTEVIIPFIVDL